MEAFLDGGGVSRLGVSLLGTSLFGVSLLGDGVGIDCCLAMADPRDDEADGGVDASFRSNMSAALREFLPGGDFNASSFFAVTSGFL